MLWVVTFSVFLPSLTKSCVVCVHPSAAPRPSSAAHSQVVFMIGLPGRDLHRRACASSDHPEIERRGHKYVCGKHLAYAQDHIELSNESIVSPAHQRKSSETIHAGFQMDRELLVPSS